MPIDTTTPKYRRWHSAHVAWLVDNSGLDLIAAREMAHSILQAGLQITDIIVDDTQVNYDQLKNEHRIADADMHGWLQQRQGSGSRL